MDYKLIRSKRETLELRINDELLPEVRAPYGVSQSEIEGFLEKHKRWIEKHLPAKEKQIKLEEISKEEEAALVKKAKEYLPERTAYYAKIMELRPTGIKITSAKKRFGSCSAKNAICYSWRLMQYPPEAADYVVVHELAHIVHKNHGKRFYGLIEKYLPDYKERIKLLK